jgi:prepilin-type N-terminal cleavage/methylation domain-containing protein
MKNKGFTLVELLAVIVLLAIILAIAIPTISGLIDNSKKNAFESNAKLIDNAIDLKKLEDSSFDPSLITKDNIDEKLGLNGSNYAQVTFQPIEGGYKLIVVGSNKWDGLTAYGVDRNITVVKSDEYDGVPPIITILGEVSVEIEQGTTYVDAGATAYDLKDGDIPISSTVIRKANNEIVESVDSSIPGVYTITYSATDSSSNTISAIRTITIYPSTSLIERITYLVSKDTPSGDYTITANRESYDIEFINNTGTETTTYSSGTISLGNSTADQRMLVVAYNNLTIDSGVIVTATARKKGMFIYTSGTLTNNGEITMTARGANAVGQNVYLWKNTDNSYEYVPAVGGTGGASVSCIEYQSVLGQAGVNGTNRATGGGGSGAVYVWNDSRGVSGAGSSGTSYSGGTGGGGIYWNGASYDNTSYYAGGGVANGGAGGYAKMRDDNTSAGGGAGNPGGTGVSGSGSSSSNLNPAYNGQTGTGGLLIVYSNIIVNNGSITSNGSNGGSGTVGGGSSGGGSINIFYKSNLTNGTLLTSGGIASGASYRGGAGGAGSITTTQISF